MREMTSRDHFCVNKSILTFEKTTLVASRTLRSCRTLATIVTPTTMDFNNLENKEVYLEVLASREKNSNSIKIAILELLNDNMFRLVQSLKDNDAKLKYHQTELEGKYFRFGIGNQSMINLARGNASKILNIETRIVDIFSVFSISRMQIEAFAMSFYLFYEKIDENELNFRYDIYKIHGLTQQSKYDAKGEYGKKMKEKILKELKQAQSHMCNNTIVSGLTEKERKRYMNPPFAKLLKTDDLMDRSGLTKLNFYAMWKLYSNHIHNEHISDRQYNTMYKINKSVEDELGTNLTLMSCLTARLCNQLCSNFEAAKNELEKFDERSKIHQKVWDGLIGK